MSGKRQSRQQRKQRFVWFIVATMLLALIPATPVAAFDEPEPSTPIDFVRKNKVFITPDGDSVTTVALGPDGKVYVGTLFGTIYGLTMDAAKNVTNVQTITTIRNTPNHNDLGQPQPEIQGRLILGLTFDPQSSPSQPIMYVTHSDPRHVWDDADPLTHIDHYSGMVTRLTGPNFDAPSNRLDVITGLPRSRKNHATSGITFGPDGWLYIAQGGNTDLGAAHDTWGSIPELYLSAAILRADVRGMTTGLDVRNVDSAADLVPLQGEFELYATGFRNAYDLVWHSNGSLYVNENGANVYQGSTPGPQHGCPNGQAIVPDPQNDAIFKVTQGMHAGHPNPARGQCVFRDGTLYNPDLQPDANYQPALREYAANMGEVSMDGIIEYPLGPMAGDLVVATFSGTELLVRVILNPNGTATIARIDEVGKFDNPLDLAVDDEGVIYVAEFGLNNAPGLSLLIPEEIAVPELTLAGVSPNTGPTAGGTQVTLTGTLFQPGATVTFDGVPAGNVTVVNSTTITATTPTHAAGSVPVTVKNPDGKTATLSSGFIYTAPGGGVSLLRVNAGGGSYTDSAGHVWAGDHGFSGGSSFSTTELIAGTADPALYQSEHYGNTTYSFAMENGQYLVNLKFAEIYWSSVGQRVFDVAINGQLKLDNFDILAEVPRLTALDKSFPVTVTNGVLTITLTTVVDNAKISAIEVTSAGTGGDTTPPTVLSTSPANNASDVALNSSISVTFSEPMNTAATQAAFSLNPNHTGSFSWNSSGTTLTFTPLAAVGLLRPNETYTATIGAGATDVAGNPISAPFTWNFSTEGDEDVTPPTVTTTSPVNGAVNVATNSPISVTFSEPMFKSVTESAFSISPSHAGTFSWNGAETTLTFTPTGNLSQGQVYTVTVSTGASDQAGNAMAAPYSWSFTTQGATTPPPPTLASVSPNSGPAAGGTAVTLTGTNFVAGASVTFGGVAATNVTVVNGTTITATTPAHAEGAVAVVVTNPDTQSATLANGFTYSGSTGGGGESLLRVNAGGGSYIDGTGHVWSGDTGFSGGSSFSTSSTIAGTPDSLLYQSERWGNFSYTFNVQNGSYVVKLKFAEIYWTSPGSRIFDVAINGQLVLDNFDILAEAPPLTALDKSIPVTVTNGSVTITFTTVQDNAKVSAIEILSGTSGGGDTTPPAVNVTTPANGATNVSTSNSISVTFSEPMNKTATQAAFSLGPNHAGTFSWNGAGTVMTFTPTSGLAAGQSYTAAVSTGATDLAGNALTAPFSWTFSTAAAGDTTKPTVTGTTPADDATNVAVNSAISVTFSEAMNKTATQNAFSINPNVAGAFSWNAAGTTLTFTPTSNLANETGYTVTVGTGAADLAGNTLATAFSFNFTTAAPASAPAPDLTSVAPNSGPASGGTAVTLTGTNFVAGASVTFGGAAATNVSVVNGTTITATTPAHAAGSVAVVVTNPDGKSDTLTGGFTYTTGSGGGGGESLLRVNAGGGSYADGTGHIWSGDTGFSGGSSYSVGNPITGTPDSFLYQSERWGNFSYTFNLQNGSYVVKLKFAEVFWTDPGSRIFDVAINGQVVLDNFDILAEVPRLTALDKTFPVNVTNGSVTITFTTVEDNAKISAIEILSDTSGGGDTTAPTVSSTNPAADATGVAANTNITATFSEPMNQASVQSAFSINPAVAGVFSWNGAGTTLTFNPNSNLAAGTSYSVTIGTGAEDLAGNNLAAPFTWSFTTAQASPGDTTPPTVTGTSPADDATNVGVGSTVSVTFSEPMTQAATQAAFNVSPTVTGAFSWNGAGTTLTFTPDNELAEETTYTVTIATGATDLAGNPLAALFSFNFTTASAGGGGDPSLGEWTTMPALPDPRAEVGVVEAGGLIYVLGGFSNEVSVFDPDTQTWDDVAPHPGTAVDHAGAASVNGIVYMIGGLTNWPNEAVNTVRAYDPATDTWTEKAPLPRDRGAMGIAVLDGLIYAIGGLVDGGTAVADVTVYNPATNTWTTLAPMPTPRDHLTAEAINGRIHALGGRPVAINSPVTAHEAYNPATNTWESRAPLPVARGGHGSAVLNGKIIIFGGEGNVTTPSGTFENTDEYDPTTNTWRSLAPMITPRHGMDGAVVDGVIYVPGGGPQAGGSSSAAHEAFSFLTQTSMAAQTVFSVAFLIVVVVWFEISHRRPRKR